MVSPWISALRASCVAAALAGCVPYSPYAPYAGGYAPSPYGGGGGGYYPVDPDPPTGYYPQGGLYGGYEGVQYERDYGRRRGDDGQVYRQQQNYNQALVAQQRQQNQTVVRQQQYNNAVVAQQNAYNQALLAQQRAAQGR